MRTNGNNSCPTILHIASGDLWAGAEVQLFTLAKSLHSILGFPVVVVLLNHGTLERKLLDAGIRVIILDESRLNGLQILLMLVRIIREQKPDVVHTHRIKENILGSIAALFAGGIPTLRTVHGAPEHRPTLLQFPKYVIRFIDRLSGKHLQRSIIAVSDDLADILKKDFSSKKITVIENGIDLDIIHNNYINKRQYPDTTTDNFCIGIAGRLTPVKRIDLFIQTAQYLQENHPDLNASYYIFGDGPMRDELEILSNRLKTNKAVYFEGHCEDIYRNLQDLDVLLITSDHEGLPMILLEAMALKVPVIAHAVGGIPKVLDYGSCGILVQNHSASGYGNAIYHLASSHQAHDDITNKALNRVTKYYSAERNARKYALLYTEE